MQEEEKMTSEYDHHEHDEAHCHESGSGHEHGHNHIHTHEHTHDGVTHTHVHNHVHSHEHTHDGDPAEEVTALLAYMADHNRHHAAELAELGEKLRSMGRTEAADKISEGVAEFTKANERLAEALEIIKPL